MEKSKEELLAYALKMRERGDRYRSILAYLERECNDQQTIDHVISIVDNMESKKTLKVDKSMGVKPDYTSLIFGSLFIGSGLFLVVFLWEKGWISIIPFILISMGIYGLGKSRSGNRNRTKP